MGKVSAPQQLERHRPSAALSAHAPTNPPPAGAREKGSLFLRENAPRAPKKAPEKETQGEWKGGAESGSSAASTLWRSVASSSTFPFPSCLSLDPSSPGFGGPSGGGHGLSGHTHKSQVTVRVSCLKTSPCAMRFLCPTPSTNSFHSACHSRQPASVNQDHCHPHCKSTGRRPLRLWQRHSTARGSWLISARMDGRPHHALGPVS